MLKKSSSSPSRHLCSFPFRRSCSCPCPCPSCRPPGPCLSGSLHTPFSQHLGQHLKYVGCGTCLQNGNDLQHVVHMEASACWQPLSPWTRNRRLSGRNSTAAFPGWLDLCIFLVSVTSSSGKSKLARRCRLQALRHILEVAVMPPFSQLFCYL